MISYGAFLFDESETDAADRLRNTYGTARALQLAEVFRRIARGPLAAYWRTVAETVGHWTEVPPLEPVHETETEVVRQPDPVPLVTAPKARRHREPSRIRDERELDAARGKEPSEFVLIRRSHLVRVRDLKNTG